jgi:mono/diheme cytochrome c family protein
MRYHVIGWMVVGVFAVFTAGAFAQAQVDKGMKVYGEQKCSICHSIGGKGNAKGPLDEIGSKHSADEIRAWIVTPAEMTAKTKATRKPAMKAYASLSKEDLDALVAYMQTLKKK